MNSLHDKIANAEMQKKQLASGRTVYVDFNVMPSPDWKCKNVGTPQVYDWSLIKVQAQLHPLANAHTLLTQKALDYANQQNLKVNYINLQTPIEKQFSTTRGRLTTSRNLNSDATAVALYYQCQKINPEHKIGWERRYVTSVNVGAPK